MLDKILRYIGNEKLYNKVVIAPLILELISRITGDNKIKRCSMRLYKFSRDIRALEEFIYVYKRTGNIEYAIKRAELKLRKRYK